MMTEKNPTMAKGKKRIVAVEKTMSIVEALSGQGSMTVSDLSDHVGLPASTVYYHLQTLEQNGYVKKRNSKYELGLQFLEIGHRVREQKQLYRVAKPKLQELVKVTGEMCNVMIEENGLGYHVVRLQSMDAVWADPRIGDPGVLHCRALGKAILACLPDDRVEKIIEEHGFVEMTENTITDTETLFDELETIREEGVAFDDEERMLGVRCVAAPIKSSDGRPLGSISVTGPKDRIQGDYFQEELPDLVKDTARVIEINVNY